MLRYGLDSGPRLCRVLFVRSRLPGNSHNSRPVYSRYFACRKHLLYVRYRLAYHHFDRHKYAWNDQGKDCEYDPRDLPSCHNFTPDFGDYLLNFWAFEPINHFINIKCRPHFARWGLRLFFEKTKKYSKKFFSVTFLKSNT